MRRDDYEEGQEPSRRWDLPVTLATACSDGLVSTDVVNQAIKPLCELPLFMMSVAAPAKMARVLNVAQTELGVIQFPPSSDVDRRSRPVLRPQTHRHSREDLHAARCV